MSGTLPKIIAYAGGFAAAVIAVFVLYVGLALWVALFDPDHKRADRARAVLAELLRLFRVLVVELASIFRLRRRRLGRWRPPASVRLKATTLWQPGFRPTGGPFRGLPGRAGPDRRRPRRRPLPPDGSGGHPAPRREAVRA
jgi:hypothetical protein